MLRLISSGHLTHADTCTTRPKVGDKHLPPITKTNSISKGTGIIYEMSYQDYINPLVPFLIM
ncbi:hypothetical protein [Proteus myxofaciens]|uniref:hypothetical protein n=1 Tax=Proteus myxofaciens TaxID=184072 RepID=UPI000832D783|nr:hypothetical protein [Proteus myxofaciens]